MSTVIFISCLGLKVRSVFCNADNWSAVSVHDFEISIALKRSPLSLPFSHTFTDFILSVSVFVCFIYVHIHVLMRGSIILMRKETYEKEWFVEFILFHL